MKVKDLRPGDEVISGLGGSATFVAAVPHPHYHGLALVVWAEVVLPPVIDKDSPGWSLDALSWEQEVGEVTTEKIIGERGSRLWGIFKPLRDKEGS